MLVCWPVDKTNRLKNDKKTTCFRGKLEIEYKPLNLAAKKNVFILSHRDSNLTPAKSA